MSLFETTKKGISKETDLDDLNALSERIDVMYLFGGKFEDEEYIELLDLLTSKIDEIKAIVSGASETESYKEKEADEVV